MQKHFARFADSTAQCEPRTPAHSDEADLPRDAAAGGAAAAAHALAAERPRPALEAVPLAQAVVAGVGVEHLVADF